MTIALLLLALLGHAFLWVGLINRVHSVPLRHRTGLEITAACFLIMAVVPIWFAWRMVAAEFPWQTAQIDDWMTIPIGWLAYLGVCWLTAVASTARWAWSIALRRTPSILRLHRRRPVATADDFSAEDSHEHSHHYMVHVPGNEILELDLTDRAIDVARLAPALDGLCIMHLSDFHYTGRVGKAYFREVVRLCNQQKPDMVAITGDLIDDNDLIDWMPDTLGNLESRHGVYFVLGNHDIRFDVERLRATLADHGLIDLGGRWVEREVRGERIILAGNELPWIAPAADMSDCPPRTPGGGPLRIVLSHSPDQLPWAQSRDADLFLAGHTPDGRICYPFIGPLFSPSRLGVMYAEGIFHAPPTIMHVTRGISGQVPVRFNCPPEMSRLVLHVARGE